jgi:hypothetical protein
MRTERLYDPPVAGSALWEVIGEIEHRCSEPHLDGTPPTLSTVIDEVAACVGVRESVVRTEIRLLEDSNCIQVERHARLDPEVVWP